MATTEAQALRQSIAREAAAGPALKRQVLGGAVDCLQRRLGKCSAH